MNNRKVCNSRLIRTKIHNSITLDKFRLFDDMNAYGLINDNAGRLSYIRIQYILFSANSI